MSERVVGELVSQAAPVEKRRGIGCANGLQDFKYY